LLAARAGRDGLAGDAAVAVSTLQSDCGSARCPCMLAMWFFPPTRMLKTEREADCRRYENHAYEAHIPLSDWGKGNLWNSPN
jgi:hypothetical protein